MTAYNIVLDFEYSQGITWREYIVNVMKIKGIKGTIYPIYAYKQEMDVPILIGFCGKGETKSWFFDYQLNQTNVDTIYNGGCPTDFSSLTPVVYIKDLESATYDGIEWTALDTGSLGGNFTSINLNGVITDSPCP